MRLSSTVVCLILDFRSTSEETHESDDDEADHFGSDQEEPAGSPDELYGEASTTNGM